MKSERWTRGQRLILLVMSLIAIPISIELMIYSSNKSPFASWLMLGAFACLGIGVALLHEAAPRVYQGDLYFAGSCAGYAIGLMLLLWNMPYHTESRIITGGLFLLMGIYSLAQLFRLIRRQRPKA